MDADRQEQVRLAIMAIARQIAANQVARIPILEKELATIERKQNALIAELQSFGDRDDPQPR